jgi:hypothetical protein
MKDVVLDVLVFVAREASTVNRCGHCLGTNGIPAVLDEAPDGAFLVYVSNPDAASAVALLQEQGFLEVEHRLPTTATGCVPSLAWGATSPRWMEYTLRLILSAKDREVVLSDLAEEYATIMVPKFGLRRARFWYLSQVVRSCAPLLKGRVWRLVAEVLRRAM